MTGLSPSFAELYERGGWLLKIIKIAQPVNEQEENLRANTANFQQILESISSETGTLSQSERTFAENWAVFISFLSRNVTHAQMVLDNVRARLREMILWKRSVGMTDADLLTLPIDTIMDKSEDWNFQSTQLDRLTREKPAVVNMVRRILSDDPNFKKVVSKNILLLVSNVANIIPNLTDDEIRWITTNTKYGQFISNNKDVNASKIALFLMMVRDGLSLSQPLKETRMQEAEAILNQQDRYRTLIEDARTLEHPDGYLSLSGGWKAYFSNEDDTDLLKSIEDFTGRSNQYGDFYYLVDGNGVPMALLTLDLSSDNPTYVGIRGIQETVEFLKGDIISHVRELMDLMRQNNRNPIWVGDDDNVNSIKDLEFQIEQDSPYGFASGASKYGGSASTYIDNFQEIFDQASDNYGFHSSRARSLLDILVSYAYDRGEEKMFKEALLSEPWKESRGKSTKGKEIYRQGKGFQEHMDALYWDYQMYNQEYLGGYPEREDFEEGEDGTKEYQDAIQEYESKEQGMLETWGGYEFIQMIEQAIEWMRKKRIGDKRKARETQKKREKEGRETEFKQMVERIISNPNIDESLAFARSTTNWFKLANRRQTP